MYKVASSYVKREKWNGTTPEIWETWPNYKLQIRHFKHVTNDMMIFLTHWRNPYPMDEEQWGTFMYNVTNNKEIYRCKLKGLDYQKFQSNTILYY